MARRVTRAAQNDSASTYTPSQLSKAVLFSVPPESTEKQQAKRTPAPTMQPTKPTKKANLMDQPRSSPTKISAIASSPVRRSPRKVLPASSIPSPNKITVVPPITSHLSEFPDLSGNLSITFPLYPPPSNSLQSLQTSHSDTDRLTASERRSAIQNLQRTRYAHLAGISEPDLNDPDEVRHFEVDSQGSLTFLLLDGGEAWRLREVGMESKEKGQMIVGRFYVVERV